MIMGTFGQYLAISVHDHETAPSDGTIRQARGLG
jgi:hypothetical protein